MKAPFQGANVLFYLDDATPQSARITGVHADGTVFLVVFPADRSASSIQTRESVAYGPGETGCWGWNEEADGDYVYTQLIPATVWTISHSRSKYQQVFCFNQNGERIEPGESQPNPDQVILTFSPAIAGFAVLRS